MRFIHKNSIPEFMKDWINARLEAGQSIGYNDFDQKSRLNDLLREEQKYVCCYCQQRINAFKQNSKGNCHNEHLIPQKGIHGRADLQMNYFNIYASCSYSEGLTKKHQYCGIAKADKLIGTFIRNQNCQTYFKYNAKGEILPNDDAFGNYDDFLTNINNLSTDSKNVLITIKTLNLNASFLVEERKKLQTRLFRVLNKVSFETVQSKIQKFDQDSKLYPFIDMILYYMKMKK